MDITYIIYKKIHKLKFNSIHKELIRKYRKKCRYNIRRLIINRSNYGTCDICNRENNYLIDEFCIYFTKYKSLGQDYCFNCFKFEVWKLQVIENKLENINLLLDRIL